MASNDITSLSCLLSITLLALLSNIHPVACNGARILTLQEPAAPKAELLTFIRTSCNFTAYQTLCFDSLSSHANAFIRTSCNFTAYQTLCFDSLSSHANAIQTSPVQLARTALSVALGAARSTSTAIKVISTSGGQSPHVKAAMRDCMEMVGDSVAELRQSLGELIHLKMGGKDFGYQLNSIQTWVSAAITDDDTCTDGFDGRDTDGRVKWEVRRHVLNVAQLTSNALALINRLDTTSTP